MILVLVVVAAVVLRSTSAVTATTDDTAATPVVAPRAATTVPAAFTQAWRAPSGATSAPVVAGPAVVTADGSTVIGRDARTGVESWRYARNRPLCTAGAGFPDSDNGVGRLLALYEGTTGWCSELTALRPDTGARVAASNPDVRPGTRLLADGTSVVATGADFLEVWRYDLVRTLEYGAVPTPVQVGVQPRSGCTYGSTALMAGRVGVIERCPGERTDRLTLLVPDGSDGAEKPQVDFSVLLPAAGATLVAVSDDRVAVALPNPARLLVVDRSGKQTALLPLDVPGPDLAPGPPGGAATVTTDRDRVFWWTGTTTVALNATDLTPVWSAPGTLGPPVAYGGGVLMPVPGGLEQLDPEQGRPLRTIPVERPDRTSPVRLAVLGDVLLEQRGAEVVALRPAS